MTKPKTGGRKKGTPNKKTQLLAEAFENLNFDIASILADTIPELEPKDKVYACLKIMDFIYPKRKSITIEEARGPETFSEMIARQNDELYGHD